VADNFEERLLASRAGDCSAWTALAERWRPLLNLQARRLLGSDVSARIDPSDVVQETLLQAWRDLDRFRGTCEGEWVAWLRRLVAGHAAKQRRHHRAEKRSVGKEVPLPEHQGNRGLEPVPQLMDAEEAASFAAALEQLPGDMRAVVLRRVFDREPFESIASALGRSSGATRMLWTRALRMLRQRLGG
jgi:RNA polymerase sigma-70 factor (ECF subfamily)